MKQSYDENAKEIISVLSNSLLTTKYNQLLEYTLIFLYTQYFAKQA